MGMQFTFNRVTHFSRLLKAGGRLREFNFRKLTDPIESGLYHVDVADDRGDRIIFRLAVTDAGWQPQQMTSLPAWVVDAVPQMHTIVAASENGEFTD